MKKALGPLHVTGYQ